MTNAVALYHHQTAVCARKVRLVLAEKDIEWRSHIVDIWNGETLKPDYLALNPNGVVPTLVHGNRIVVESTVINEYLDEVFTTAPLMSSDPWERARIRVWTKRVDEAIHPALASVTFAMSTREIMLKKGAGELELHLRSIPDPVRRARQREAIAHGLDASVVRIGLLNWHRLVTDMQAALGGSAWLVGNRFSLADVAIAPYFYQMKSMGADWIWSEQAPAVSDWYDRVSSRASFREAIDGYLLESRTRQLQDAGARQGTALREAWRKATA